MPGRATGPPMVISFRRIIKMQYAGEIDEVEREII